MRRPLLSLCILTVALVAGCGSSSSSGGKSPLDNALGYLPKSAPVVFAFDTELRQVTPFTTGMHELPEALDASKNIQERVTEGHLISSCIQEVSN